MATSKSKKASSPLTIACVNLKGGVGKTAIAVNLAAYCGREGMRTLLVDLDPQTNATFSCIDVDQWEQQASDHGTVAHLLGARSHTNAEGSSREACDVIMEDVFPGMDLLPSHLDLFTIDLDLASAFAREKKLRKAINPVLSNYDVVVCDCPPNLTIPTQNALALCSHYVVPVSPDYLSGIGVGLLLRRVTSFLEEVEHDSKLAGIVISRVGRPAVHRMQTVAAIRKTFKKDVLTSEIKERVAVSEAAAAQTSIYDWRDPEAALEFTNMSRELLGRIGVKL